MGTTVFERRPPAASAVAHSLEQSRHAVFWTEDVPAALRPHREPLRGDARADLVVVGGGYCGLWTALLAKERDPDARVVVVEAHRVGWAASGRNGGFCEASLTHGDANGERRWPDEMPTLRRLGLENLDAIEAAEARYGIDMQFERTGQLAVATEPHQLPWLEEWAAEGEEATVLLDAEGARAAVASPTYLGAVWEQRTCALVHPGRMAAELARAAEERGVVIHERTHATGIDDDGDGVRVTTEHGSVRAARAVLATNAFPSLLRRNRLMTVPVYDFVLMTEPLDAERRASLGWEARQGVSDLANQFHYYRLTQDDRLLFGGYDAIYHPGGRVDPRHEEHPEVWERLASHALTTFPQLEGVRFSHRWAGAIDTCTRFTAFTGLARRGRVAYAAGFTGLGVASTRFAAEAMLDLLAGLDTERTRLEMVRRLPPPFPPEPLASIGIQATRWSLDRADHRQGRRNLLLRTLDALGLGFDS